MNAKDREEKVVKILKGIELFTKAEDDELKALLKEFPEVAYLVKQVNGFEKTLAKLLKDEQRQFIESVQMYIQDASTQNALVGAILDMTMSDMFAVSTFAEKLTAEATVFLTKTTTHLTTSIMKSLDPDVAFNVFSRRTTDWISSWSTDLGKLMHLKNVDAVTEAIQETLKNGDGIQTLVVKLQKLPEFNRKRARATAITEVLTASSVAQHESYMQSPSVVGKTWRHTGAKKNKPRLAHVALSGTRVLKDEMFLVNDEYGMFPRDTILSAKERVHCHCVLSPDIDEDILGLTAQERNTIREQVLRGME